MFLAKEWEFFNTVKIVFEDSFHDTTFALFVEKCRIVELNWFTYEISNSSFDLIHLSRMVFSNTIMLRLILKWLDSGFKLTVRYTHVSYR